MEIKPLEFMLVGGSWLALGAVAFATAQSLGPANGLLVVYAVALLGVLMFAVGLVRAALGDRPGTPSEDEAKTLRRNRAVVGSLLAVAAADNTLAERELNVIENFAAKLANVDMGDELVRELFDEMVAQPVSIKQELAAVAGEMSEADKMTVYQGAALVAYCLESVGPKERAALSEIAAALHLPPEATEEAEQRARDAFADSGAAATVKYWLGIG